MPQNIKITVFLNAFSEGKSGADVAFAQIAKRLKNNSLTIVTSRLGKNFCLQEKIRDGYQITSDEKKFNFKNILFVYLQRTILAISFRPVGIIWATSDFFPDVIPALVHKIFHPQTLWVQSVYHLIPRYRFAYYFLQKFSLFLINKFADKIMVDSELLKNQLINDGFLANKLFVNYPGVDHEKFKTNQTKNKIYDAVFLGQLRAQKGLTDLVKIWKIVRQKLPQAKLAIIGHGVKIKSPGIKNFGFLSDNQVRKILKSGKVFLYPSHEEGFGLAPLEAQSFGLPVVAWNLPIYQEIFPRGMILIKENNINDFTTTIIELLTKSDYYKKTSRVARKNSERFSWNKYAEKFAILCCHPHPQRRGVD